MDAAALVATSHDSIDAIPAAHWNALGLDGVPFVRHEFLAALEHTGVASPATGWTARHLAVREGAVLVGAVPLYAKAHSWGEFVFDFSWAQAYERHGLAYYPKLVAATPFTPATGPRLLVHPGSDGARVRGALCAALATLAKDYSSVHVQFASAADSQALAEHGYLARVDCQFHWQNRGYRDFEEFLATFTADKRKKAKRERRRIQEAGVHFEWRGGDTLSPAEWRQAHALHAATFHRHGHEPYLNLDFFLAASATPAIRPLVLRALAGTTLVAIAIFFQGPATLYGRYWGAAADFHSLHFEACYHQGIEYCIQHGLQRFEPGTQGEHKIARGFAPTLTCSAHLIREPRFRDAIARYLGEERRSVLAYATEAGRHVPYRADLDLIPPAA